MGAACAMAVEVLLDGDTLWSDITADTVADLGLSLRRGIDGNGPQDSTASTGSCGFAVDNSAANSGGLQGYYSPLHANCLSGWGFGVPCRVVFTDTTNDSAVSVSGITRSSQTATVTTGSSHGRSTGDWVRIAGASQAEYNGAYQITVTAATTFTYTVTGTPVTPATGTMTARRVYIAHRGKLCVIDPEAGQYLSQRVHVVSYDGMFDLGDASLREITVQLDKSEDELITEILDALPAGKQPVARDLDPGVDIIPYALHDVGSDSRALSVLKSVVDDSFGLLFVKGDGTLCFRSRDTRYSGVSSYTFTNSMHGFSAPSSQDQVFDEVRVTIHPPEVDASPTTVLYLASGTPIFVPAGETVTVWLTYQAPDEVSRTLIGAINVQNVTATTDYLANSAADGGGSNLTGSVTVTTTAFASVAKLDIANGGGTGAHMTFLRIRGQAIYDIGPQTYVSGSGDRSLPIDLRYQDDAQVARDAAAFIQAQRGTLQGQPDQLVIIANDSAAFMQQALAREVGDVFTIVEAVTGYSTKAAIQSIEHSVTAGPWVVTSFSLAPVSPFEMWLLGEDGKTELGDTTVLGF